MTKPRLVVRALISHQDRQLLVTGQDDIRRAGGRAFYDVLALILRQSCPDRNFSASSAAMQPIPALVTACR